MERTAAFQEKCWQAGFPVFPTIPRAANAIARTLRWARPACANCRASSSACLTAKAISALIRAICVTKTPVP